MTELQQIFQQREKQILEEASQLAKDVARKELALLEFEMFNEVMISKESKEKAEKSLQKLRDEKWKKALEEANGKMKKKQFSFTALPKNFSHLSLNFFLNPHHVSYLV
jgi:hypothetical protein